MRWVGAVSEVVTGQIVAFDGKRVRRSYDRRSGKEAIHRVSAWAATNRLVLGQVKTEEKSNEITAIPELLRLLDVHGCIVTIDAMGTQKAIAQQIIDQGADYVLALKGNHDHLHQEVKRLFEGGEENGFQHPLLCSQETIERGHGRLERRCYSVLEAPAWLLQAHPQWKGLCSLGRVQSKRQVGEQVARETRYYLSSLPVPAMGRFAEAVRGHWGVENPVHWVLDVVFGEDASRVRKDHAPANFGIIRRVAMNLLRQEPSKLSLRAKRYRAGLDEHYLAKLLGG